MLATLPEIDVSEFPQEAALAQAVAGPFDSEGVVILRGVAPRPLITRLRAALVAALDEDLRTYGPNYRFRGMVHALMSRGDSFLRLLENPTVRRVSQSLLGHGCIVHAYNSSSLPPLATNHSRGIHVDCPRLIPGYVTNVGWIFPLVPFTQENGAMEILPGSFRRPDQPSLEEFELGKAILDALEPGDAALFNARCWHRGGWNQTDRWRHSVTINVTRSYIRQQFDYPRMMPPATLASLSEELRQFLGCYVRMPVSMEEFQRPADERPYRPGQE